MWLLANNSILYADRKEKAVDERPKTQIAGVLGPKTSLVDARGFEPLTG
jgi:hypothetical protein